MHTYLLITAPMGECSMVHDVYLHLSLPWSSLVMGPAYLEAFIARCSLMCPKAAWDHEQPSQSQDLLLHLYLLSHILSSLSSSHLHLSDYFDSFC